MKYYFNQRNVMCGQRMLATIDSERAMAAFFDPQYRSLVEKQKYGDINNPNSRMAHVHALQGMPEWMIKNMIIELERILLPSGHLFLWIDKYMLVDQGVRRYISLTDLQPVDMITWFKVRMGMGYRSRRTSEYLVVLQKPPIRAKGVWVDNGIKDVWEEVVVRGTHPHPKPIALQTRLIECVTDPGDVVVDPAAGSYSVLSACQASGRKFLGCDLIDI